MINTKTITKSFRSIHIRMSILGSDTSVYYLMLTLISRKLPSAYIRINRLLVCDLHLYTKLAITRIDEERYFSFAYCNLYKN